ncbi:MAG: hypothetical protein KAI81_04020, partial [Candidatus Marinimicrobia bacterium]|nr:hypothetical protein [Candidatus Neomarinimicrobiota bacterium]
RTSYNVNTALEKLRDKFEQLFDFDFSFYFSVEHNAITTYSSHKFPDELKKEICGKIKEYFDDDTKQDIQEFLTSEFKFNTENSLFSDMLIKSLFANDSIVGILGFINLPPKKFISYQRDYFYHLISKLQELIFQIDSIVENQNRILSSIFDQIQSIIIRVDLESGDILTNKAGQDLLDLYKISTCNFDDIKTIFDSDWDEILEEVVNNKTYRGTSLVGEEKDILVFGLNIVAYSDPPVVNEGLLINAKDITDIKKIEDMKADIISNVSHELKTPVAIVKEYLSLLHDEISGPLNEMQHKFVGTISNNLDRLERLISSFLDMSKLNSGKMHTNFEDEKVSGLVNGIIEPFNLRYKNNNMTLTYQPEDSELIFLLDRDMIAQIMVNLLENAYKYAGKNVNVIVKSYVNEHNNLILVVQDNGKGISKKDQKKIFDRFYRAGLEEEARLPGSGLGLSIIKDMIKIIGGEIRLESVLGEGCSFFVELPSPNIEN